MMSKCKGCGSATRKLDNPGPRCATCWRQFRKAQNARSHAQRIEATYGITGEDYEALRAFQGGACAICRRATGKTRRLSVDHDHATGLVRGLLCRPCNTLIGHLRDDVTALQRAQDYLTHPPAQIALDQYTQRHGNPQP